MNKKIGCSILLNENMETLFVEIHKRLCLMKYCKIPVPINNGLSLFSIWENLSIELSKIPICSENQFIELTYIQRIKLTVIIDMVAMFFLVNGSEDEDKFFLDSVNDLVQNTDINIKNFTVEERWKEIIDSYNLPSLHQIIRADPFLAPRPPPLLP